MAGRNEIGKAETDVVVNPKVGKPKGTTETFKDGDSITLTTSGAKSTKGKVVLTKTWYCPDIGVFIDFPLTGTPQARQALGAYIIYALKKTAGKVWHIFEYGMHNPRMMKDGVSCYYTSAPIEPDGAPSRVRLELHLKGTKAGQLLATFLAKSCFSPPTGDVNQSTLFCIGKDVGAFMWAAKQYAGMIKDAGFSFMIVGGKRTSVRKAVVEKFKITFNKKFVDPHINGASAPKEIVLQPEFAAIAYKAASGVALLAMAHPMSGFGGVWISGSKIGISVPPEDQKDVARGVKRMVRNGHKAAAVIAWYGRVSSRDKIGGLGSALSAGAVGVGLPVEIAEKMASISSIDVEKIAGDVEKCVEG